MYAPIVQLYVPFVHLRRLWNTAQWELCQQRKQLAQQRRWDALLRRMKRRHHANVRRGFSLTQLADMEMWEYYRLFKAEGRLNEFWQMFGARFPSPS